MDIETRRQAVYSALYQYSAEAVPLRERALVRAVLGALLGSTELRPLQIKGIQENLSSGSSAMCLRPEVILDTINGLVSDGLVCPVKHKKRNAYFLTEAGELKVSQLAGSSEALFQEAITILFKDTSCFISNEIVTSVFTRFSFECFALYGRQIARSVTGTITRDELGKRINPRVAFEAAVKGVGLTQEQRESLEVRCQRFLRSSEPVLEKLKFHLSNGYYVTQLLGLDRARFNPLAEQAFNGAVFYLDTNVLLLGLFRDHEDAGEFSEMVNLAKRIGVEVSKTGVRTQFSLILAVIVF